MTRFTKSSAPEHQMSQAEINEIMEAEAVRNTSVIAHEYEALRKYAYEQILLDDAREERREDQFGRLRRRRR